MEGKILNFLFLKVIFPNVKPKKFIVIRYFSSVYFLPFLPSKDMVKLVHCMHMVVIRMGKLM